jgi:hypothetical protein
MGQKIDGTTVNATVSMNAAGEVVYNLNNSFDISVNLSNSSGTVVEDTANGGNDAYALGASRGDTISGGAGDSTFIVSPSAGGLNGDILKGGAGVNVIELQGSGEAIDLTQGSSGIEAVVGQSNLSGQSVNLNLSQISSSTLTDQGAGPCKAFVALIGLDGQVNLNNSGAYQLVGVMNAAGAGFAADGTPLDAAETAALAADVTNINDVAGTLAADFSPRKAAGVLADLNAYVFAKGSTTYTVWTDGAVTITYKNGDTLSAYQPAPSVSTDTAPGTFAQFTKSGTWSAATVSVSAAGLSSLSVSDGAAQASASVIVNGVSGTVIHGDSGANGGDWFGLGLSGGSNVIYGSTGSDIFDLQGSASLADILNAGAGFNVVQAPTAGADIDLTANNGSTSVAAKGIDAVVGGLAATKAGGGQTVEVDPNGLTYAVDALGAKSAVFEALLGSTAATVTLEGNGTWVEVATFGPGAALPAHAAALQDASMLDALYGASKAHTAENALTGYLFENVNAKGAALKYATLYTDATVDNTLAAPSATVLAQAMAQFAVQSASPTMPIVNAPPVSAISLAVRHA